MRVPTLIHTSPLRKTWKEPKKKEAMRSGTSCHGNDVSFSVHINRRATPSWATPSSLCSSPALTDQNQLMVQIEDQEVLIIFLNKVCIKCLYLNVFVFFKIAHERGVCKDLIYSVSFICQKINKWGMSSTKPICDRLPCLAQQAPLWWSESAGMWLEIV